MQNFVFALLKLILHFFSVAPNFQLLSKVGPSHNTYFKDSKYEMMNYFQH